MLHTLLNSFEDVIESNGELHPRISHLQGGMDAFNWRKTWLRPRKKEQRRYVRCCNEERHWNGWPYTTHNLVHLYALPAAACVHILLIYREQQTEHRRITILVMHDVIDCLELCTCPFTVTFKYSQTKYPRLAAVPQKLHTLNHVKIKVHMVKYIKLRFVCFVCLTKPVMGETLHWLTSVHGVLNRPKKDQVAINSACLITFTR